MTEEHLSAQPEAADDLAELSLEVELNDEIAERTIEKAVRGRRALARKYVRWVRRRNPEATPAEVVTLLEQHYISAISAAGVAVTVGTIAAEIGISLLPGAGGAKAVAREAGKKATKEAAKAAAKQATKASAKAAAASGARKAVAMIPAGDEQLQFEITALFAFALADIHGLEFDLEQGQALVYGLSNGRVGQQQIATMAADLANSSASGTSVGHAIARGHGDWSHWANTLADSLPGGAAQNLVRGVQTGVLEDVRAGLGGKQQSAVEYGVGALVGGVTRFVFGREVVEACHAAFAEPPSAFPAYLDVPPKPEKDEREANQALVALQEAAKSVGQGVGGRAAAVGAGVSTAADAVTQVFRSVDLDGDGVPDEPQALTAVKNLASAAGSMTGPFRSVDLDGDGVPDEPQALAAVKRLRKSTSFQFKSEKRGDSTSDGNESDLGSDLGGHSSCGRPS